MLETQTPTAPLFSTDKKPALEAISMAQFIAFAPYVFQASVVLRDSNVLRLVEQNREGSTVDELAKQVNMSVYAVRVLLEAGLGIGLVYRQDDKFFLAKTGHFFLNDPMTRINTDFMRDVCYDGAQDLEASLKEGRPAGLRHLGDWETIYQGLSIMKEPARTSWFDFDHYYSDNAFPIAMPLIFSQPVKKVMDIGANTGKFTLACLGYDSDVEVGLVDLQVQLNVAKQIVADAGYTDRAKFIPVDMLDEKSELPTGYDVIWMSQFLDCFAEHQVFGDMAISFASGENEVITGIYQQPGYPDRLIEMELQKAKYTGLKCELGYNYLLFKNRMNAGVSVSSRNYFGKDAFTQYNLNVNFGYNFNLIKRKQTDCND